jgi:DNA-binding GntR family transcriptional regulator
MNERNIGLTETYNQLHDANCDDLKINELRSLQVEMDQAAANAYGWSGFNCQHDFYETKQGMRFTLSEAARREVLKRLLDLNHARADLISIAQVKGTSKRQVQKKITPQANSAGLFDGDNR